jgi:hypothetical protein
MNTFWQRELDHPPAAPGTLLSRGEVEAALNNAAGEITALTSERWRTLAEIQADEAE